MRFMGQTSHPSDSRITNTRTKRRVKKANVAVQIPVLTANITRRCKRCVVVLRNVMIRHLSATPHTCAHAYFAPELSHCRTSKNVKQMAIKTSTAPATERERVARACPYHGEVFHSENKNLLLFLPRTRDH